MFNAEGFLVYQRVGWHEVADVAGIVFQFLDQEDLRSCACVTSKLREVADDDALWENLLLWTYNMSAMFDQKKNSSNASPKTVFKQQWLKPRSNVFKAMQRLRMDMSSVSSYQERSGELSMYGAQAAQLGLSGYWEANSRKIHQTGTKNSVYHQLRTTLLCCGGMGAMSMLHAKAIGPAALLQSALEELAQTPGALVKSKWGMLMIAGAVLAGLRARLKRPKTLKNKMTIDEREDSTKTKKKHLLKKHGRKPSATDAAVSRELTTEERTQVLLNFAIKELNDGLLAYVLLPMTLLTGLKGIEWFQGYFHGRLLWWLGTISLLGWLLSLIVRAAGLPRTQNFARVIQEAFFAIGLMLCYWFNVPIVVNGIHNIFQVALFGLLMALAFWGLSEKYTTSSRSKTQRLFGACAGISFFGAFRMVAPDKLWSLLLGGIGSTLTLEFLNPVIQGAAAAAAIVQGAADVATGAGSRASSFMLLSRVPMAESLGLLAISSLLNRWATTRAATMLYAKRWETNPILSVLFDAVSTRVFVNDGLGTAVIVRVICASLYVIISG